MGAALVQVELFSGHAAMCIAASSLLGPSKRPVTDPFAGFRIFPAHMTTAMDSI
jgi:hypothetical protein